MSVPSRESFGGHVSGVSPERSQAKGNVSIKNAVRGILSAESFYNNETEDLEKGLRGLKVKYY